MNKGLNTWKNRQNEREQKVMNKGMKIHPLNFGIALESACGNHLIGGGYLSYFIPISTEHIYAMPVKIKGLHYRY